LLPRLLARWLGNDACVTRDPPDIGRPGNSGQTYSSSRIKSVRRAAQPPNRSALQAPDSLTDRCPRFAATAAGQNVKVTCERRLHFGEVASPRSKTGRLSTRHRLIGRGAWTSSDHSRISAGGGPDQRTGRSELQPSRRALKSAARPVARGDELAWVDSLAAVGTADWRFSRQLLHACAASSSFLPLQAAATEVALISWRVTAAPRPLPSTGPVERTGLLRREVSTAALQCQWPVRKNREESGQTPQGSCTLTSRCHPRNKLMVGSAADGLRAASIKSLVRRTRARQHRY
jgi:hypothetical protein